MADYIKEYLNGSSTVISTNGTSVTGNYFVAKMQYGLVEQNFAENYSIVDIILKISHTYYTLQETEVTYTITGWLNGSSESANEWLAANGGTGTITIGGTQSSTTITVAQIKFPHTIDGEARLNLGVRLEADEQFTFEYMNDAYPSLTSNYNFISANYDVTLPTMTVIPPYISATYPSQAALMTDEANLGIYIISKSAWAISKMEAAITVAHYEAGVEDYGVEFEFHRVELPTDTDGTYYFSITDEERSSMRYFLRNVNSYEYKFYLYSTCEGVDVTKVETRTAHITNCNPVLANATVVDANSTTVGLTGDENVLVYGESMAEYSVDISLAKEAELENFVVKNGEKQRTTQYGVFDDVESGLFTFDLTDSRGKSATTSVEKTIIPYLKPTCYQKVEVELVEEDVVKATYKVSGSIFSGSFGAVDNTIKVEMRHTNNEGEMTDWTDVTVLLASNSNNSYELTTTITGLTYRASYDFQCRVTDELYTVQSATYTAYLEPVFDWGENDFNFNVPIYMNEQPVLRHNKDGNHTIISASGGRIHLRPNGTDDEFGEVIIYPDGTLSTAASTDAYNTDFVVDCGSEAMGTNGTWYWEKWYSGKAVCWGRRNFGAMAIDTDWGGFYRGDILTQDLPTDLFYGSPSVVDISFYWGSHGGWIVRHESTMPSSTSSGAFMVVRPATATLTESHISFHVIGRWKEAEA